MLISLTVVSNAYLGHIRMAGCIRYLVLHLNMIFPKGYHNAIARELIEAPALDSLNLARVYLKTVNTL